MGKLKSVLLLVVALLAIINGIRAITLMDRNKALQVSYNALLNDYNSEVSRLVAQLNDAEERASQVPEKVYIEVPVIVEKEVIKEVIIEKEVSKELRYFKDQVEAQAWFDKLRVTVFSPNVCQIVAHDIMKLAIKDGYIVYPVPVYQGRIWGIKVTSITEYHMGILVPACEFYYYVEIVDEDMKVKQIRDGRNVIITALGE